jgi:hypothetical protein
MQTLSAIAAFTGFSLGAGAGVAASTLFFDGAGNPILKASKLEAEPDHANTHISYMGDASMDLHASLVNHVSKVFQIPKVTPAAGDPPYDRFSTGSAVRQPMLDLSAFRFGGTTAIGSVVQTGAGLNDLTATAGSFTGNVAAVNFVVQIDSTGTPDTFQWSVDGGVTFVATLVPITGVAQTLTHGSYSIKITFAATTGHTLNDSWAFTGSSEKMRVIIWVG